MTDPRRGDRHDENTNQSGDDTDIEVTVDPDPDEALVDPPASDDVPDDTPDPDLLEAQPGDVNWVDAGVETPIEPTP